MLFRSAADELIIANAAIKLIVARVAGELVVTVQTVEVVGATTTVDSIGADAAEDLVAKAPTDPGRLNDLAQAYLDAFTQAGLPYFNPHSFRNTLVRLGQSVCRTPEDFKAWSQNLGHEQVLTTFLSYGEVAMSRQREIMRTVGARPPVEMPDDDFAAKVLQIVRAEGLAGEIRARA